VLPNQGPEDFRDPKVFRDEAREQWVMTLAAHDRVQFYGSKNKNMKEWVFMSEWGPYARNHGGVWECPDLFPITIEETGEESRVLIVSTNPGGANGGSGSFYFTGHWDGKEFTSRREAIFSPTDTIQWIDHCRDNYAGVTFNNLPDNRRILPGWMSSWMYANEVPTDTWRSAMTIPPRAEPARYRFRNPPTTNSAEIFFDEGDPVLTDIFFPEAPFTKLTIEAGGSVGEGMPTGWRLNNCALWGLK